MTDSSSKKLPISDSSISPNFSPHIASQASSSPRVMLVGHCGPDSSYLRQAVKSALGAATFISADDNPSMNHGLEEGIDLALVNRELGWGFEPATGVEMIRELKSRLPRLRVMLISNYPEAQHAAEEAGALPGFGKREIGSARVKGLLREALAAQLS